MRHAILNASGKVLGYLSLDRDYDGENLVAKNVDKKYLARPIDDDVYCVIDKVSICVGCMACTGRCML